jgi:hypothetical protein
MFTSVGLKAILMLCGNKASSVCFRRNCSSRTSSRKCDSHRRYNLTFGSFLIVGSISWVSFLDGRSSVNPHAMPDSHPVKSSSDCQSLCENLISSWDSLDFIPKPFYCGEYGKGVENERGCFVKTTKVDNLKNYC